MKKFISFMLVLMLCVAVTIPAVAAETFNGFVPSIGYKEGPDVVGALLNGQELEGCIIVTTIKQADEKTTDITQEERDELLRVYRELSNGTMSLPDPSLVIRELVDVSFMYEGCRQLQDHGDKPEALAEKDVLATVKFELDIDAETELFVYVYHNNTWTQVEGVTNNGDGTVTVDFEDICPVAFAVRPSAAQTSVLNPAGTGAGAQTGGSVAGEGGQGFPWWILILVAVVVVVGAVVVSKKKKK